MIGPADYHVVTRWRVAGTCGEVADVIGDAASLARWWPAVYLRVDELEPPDSRGVGRRLRLLTTGWLPYTLTWELTVTESRYPNGLSLTASGDVVGTGVWTFAQDGDTVAIVFDWRVRATQPRLRQWSRWLRPLFAANHRWAMRQGEESLRLELQRRRAASAAAKAAVPPPPGPVTYAGVALVGGAAVIGGTLAYLLIRARRRQRP